MTISKVLIANRGEIAVRIARAARDAGITSVAVYSDADADALHARVADEAYALHGNSSAQTYMNIPALLDIAARTGADALHPGYGFLSENPDFARAVTDAGLTWIGPSPESIELLGDKIAARRVAEEVGAPLAPGTSDPIEDWEQARAFAEEHGLPIAIKAAFGGGGRGLKVVERMEDIEDGFASAGREAKEAFGRAECYVEKFLVHPRHVEAQVLADAHGNVRVLGTRDCSTQRRFQKLIEESPAPFLSDTQREEIAEGARNICAKAGYVGAGTVEFIVSEDGTISFLEVNTRVQVEHPVTEATTGVDIIAEQFRIAAGLPLSFDADPAPRGHAFEFRINAEDVAHGFAPCPGSVLRFEPPTGPGIRVDSAVRSGASVPPFYDSLIAKLIVWGPDRETALRRSRQALAEFDIEGVRTVLPFHRDMLTRPELVGTAEEFGVYTDWVDKHWRPAAELFGGDIAEAYTPRERLTVEIDGRLHTVGLPAALFAGAAGAASGSAATANATPSGGGAGAPSTGSGQAGSSPDAHVLTSPYPGTVVAWEAEDGAQVTEGQAVVTIEAMKMESKLTATASGVLRITAQVGAKLAPGDALAEIE